MSLMTRSQFAKAVGEKLGRPINFSSILYGQARGEIDKGERQPDGWFLYGPKHLEQAIAYFNRRTHRTRVSTASSR